MAKAIRVENLSKAYQLGDFGTGTIARDLERYWARVRGKEDPFFKIGETNDRTVKGQSNVVWSLKDINLEVEQGDAVGIIGCNGAGKSTFLKILSRVTSPTTGTIKAKGRIASLLEVGTGFHPELTGRENIYLNGAILGMRKKEISRKFDEILDFAGVDRYVDTPVKRYSSGMYVRLAFAVAAHLESEILIVDEVLAVGDSEFQKKCLGKMGEVSKGEGRTVLFVSHNMAAVETLTSKSIYIINGRLDTFGKTRHVIDQYLSSRVKDKGVYVAQPKTDRPNITRVEIVVSELDGTHMNGEDLYIDIDVAAPYSIDGLALSVQIINEHEVPVIYTYTYDGGNIGLKQQGLSRLRCILHKCRLYANIYYLRVHLAETKSFTKFEEIDRICEFEVVMPNKLIAWGWQKDLCIYTEEFKWTELA